MKRANSAALAIAVLLGSAVAGCHQSSDRAPVDTGQTDAASAPATDLAAANSLTLTDGTIVLPAVAGRPGAAYFTITNGTDHPATLTGVAISGAKQAEMHQTSGGAMEAVSSVEIPAGGSVAFAPGGRHVMVFGLPASLHAGGTATLTASFKGGDKLSTTVTARAPGAAASDAMPGMKMD